MRVVVFFLCLCTLLSGGNNRIYTGSARQNGISYAQAQPTEKSLQATFMTAGEDRTISRNTNSNPDEEYFIGDDVEDEDANSFFAGKYSLLVRCCLALSQLFLLSYLYKRIKALPHFYGHPSYKYITQRALRI